MAKITTLTPVHIGSGVMYNRGIDFVHEGDKVGIIDPLKVANLIGNDPNTINQWVHAIDTGVPLLDFLRKSRGLKNVRLDDISDRICMTRNISHVAQNLKEQYRTSIEGVSIPGSSLKGAMKTTVWDNLANDTFLKKITSQDLKNNKGRWSDRIINEKLFGKSANEQSTRFLKVGDIHFGFIQSEVYEIKVLNKNFSKWRFKEGSTLFETIPSGIQSNFNFKIDELLLKRNIEYDFKKWPKEKVEFLQRGNSGLAKIVNDFTLGLIQWELDVLENEDMEENVAGEDLLNEYDRIYKIAEQCQADEFVVRIGGHSGWVFTTGGWIRKEALNISDMKYLRKMIQRGKEYDMTLWPKTRKTTNDGTILGFVKIQL